MPEVVPEVVAGEPCFVRATLPTAGIGAAVVFLGVTNAGLPGAETGRWTMPVVALVVFGTVVAIGLGLLVWGCLVGEVVWLFFIMVEILCE